MKQKSPTKSEIKTDTLFRFFVDNGFEHSLKTIAIELHITQRALMYRYGSKEAMVDFILSYWRKQWQYRFEKQTTHCNHIVEILLLFILKLRESFIHEQPFFLRELEEQNFLNRTLPHSFLSLLEKLLITGIDQDYFKKIDIYIYSRLLLFNIVNLFIMAEEPFDSLSYIVEPLLTEKGESALNAINTELYFCIFAKKYNEF